VVASRVSSKVSSACRGPLPGPLRWNWQTGVVQVWMLKAALLHAARCTVHPDSMRDAGPTDPDAEASREPSHPDPWWRERSDTRHKTPPREGTQATRYMDGTSPSTLDQSTDPFIALGFPASSHPSSNQQRATSNQQPANKRPREAVNPPS
jgi:hypothetical protein